MGRRAGRSAAQHAPAPAVANAGGDDFGEGEEAGNIDAGSKVHILQPNRDPVANWEVDLAKNLEEYLLKICSGELASEQNHGQHSVNFAEAALLLQGSAQVYGRKVEYLYTLVLRALEFIKSDKRQDQQEDLSDQPNRGGPATIAGEENEHFLGLDDVPEDAKSCLNNSNNNEDSSHVLKPPANLVVLEGDCLNTSGEGGELESYLLSTCNFYGHFLLLDPIDAGAVQYLLKGKAVSKEQIEPPRGSSVRSKTYNPFSSPVGRSGGSRHKSSVGKKQPEVAEEPLDQNPVFENADNDTGFVPDADHISPHGFMEPDFGFPGDAASSEDDDDPWKPLNPHEPGNLKVKPFKKAKNLGRKQICSTKNSLLAHEFPIAKPAEMISSEFSEALRLYPHVPSKAETPQSPPPFEKLRQSLVFEEHNIPYGNGATENDIVDGIEDDYPDNEHDDFDMSHNVFDMDGGAHAHTNPGDNNFHFDNDEPLGNDLDPDASLEDLCRSHLDKLLASIAETEKQTELAARVSTWKQRIEHSLEEQDSRKPFDIHLYGEKFLDRLSTAVDVGGSLCFTDLVKGHEKFNIARTFSAMLQLVNNGNIDLIRKVPKNESTCYSATNPFHVKLLSAGGSKEETQELASKKRVKSPSIKACSDGIPSPPLSPPAKTKHRNGKTLKSAKGNKLNSTAETKKRRTSRLIEHRSPTLFV